MLMLMHIPIVTSFHLGPRRRTPVTRCRLTRSLPIPSTRIPMQIRHVSTSRSSLPRLKRNLHLSHLPNLRIILIMKQPILTVRPLLVRRPA